MPPFETYALPVRDGDARRAGEANRLAAQISHRYERIAAEGGHVVAHNVIELSPDRNFIPIPHVMITAEFPDPA